MILGNWLNSTLNKIKILYLLLVASSCSSGDSAESSEISDATFVSSFDFQPAAPQNGKLLGIIELSFSGFNSFIVEIDDQDRWSLDKAVYGESYVAQGGITLEHVLSSIESYKSEMVKLGLDENDINLVASSSAFENEKVKKIADQLRTRNIGLISVTLEQEATYAFHATVPKNLSDRSYLIDIGSGSSKISWMENNEVMAIKTYGSKYHLQGVADLEVYHALKEAVAQVPNQNKSLCFLVGGAAFKLATSTDARAGRYTILEHPDQYLNQQEPSGLNIYNAIYSEATYNYIFDWDANFTIGILMSVN